MPNADTTLIERAEAAGVSLATYVETRGHLQRGVRSASTAQSSARSYDLEVLIVNQVDGFSIQFERAKSGCPVMTARKGAELDERLVLLDNVARTGFVNDINLGSEFSFLRHGVIR